MLFPRAGGWRYDRVAPDYDSCRMLNATVPGILILQEPPVVEFLASGFQYEPGCSNGFPIYAAMRQLPYPMFPQVAEDWQLYISHGYGLFHEGIYPVMFVVAACFALTLFLLILVFANYTRNSLVLLRAALMLATAYLVAFFVTFLVKLSAQGNRGYTSLSELVLFLRYLTAFLVVDLVVVLLLQICQVQVVMRLFNRQKDKRTAFYVGTLLLVGNQVIWAVATFDNSSVVTSLVLPAFIYLLRIAIAILYLGLVCIFIFLRRDIVCQRLIALLTLVTFLVVNSSVVLFVFDVASVWVLDLSEVFNVACYVAAVVIPWEWVNLVELLQLVREKNNVLGREIYEEEGGLDVAFFDPVGGESGDEHSVLLASSRSHTASAATLPKNRPLRSATTPLPATTTPPLFWHRVLCSLGDTANRWIHITDEIIAKVFAVPPSLHDHRHEPHPIPLQTILLQPAPHKTEPPSDKSWKAKVAHAKGRLRAHPPHTPRLPRPAGVYVYSRRQLDAVQLRPLGLVSLGLGRPVAPTGSLNLPLVISLPPDDSSGHLP